MVLLASITRSYATLDFYDSFNYTNVNVQLAAAASPSWITYAGGGAHPTNIAGSLSYPGLSTASGDNSPLFNGSGASGVTAHSLSQRYNITNAPTVYYSLTFKVTSISTADWGNLSANYIGGSYMLGFNQKATNNAAIVQADAAAPLLIRTGDPNNTSGTANDFQEFQLGVGVTATATNRIFDGTHNYHPGDTLFIVVSYTFNPGINDDVAKLYVNPTPGTLETDNTPVVVTTTGALDVSTNQMQSFFLRNNSVEPSSTQIDDLRVGTTWADVTPMDVHALRIEWVSPKSVLSWPTNLTGFILQTNNTFDTNWGPLALPVVPIDGRFYVTNSSPNQKLFFRLRK